MSPLKYYFDIMSQPCRAVYMFLKINGIPFEEKPVALRKGEHMTPEFTKINPFQKVPVIDDNGFILTESVAILHYLAGTHQVAPHWYPKDLKLRSRVDEYTAWQHFNTRFHAAMYFRVQYNVDDHWYPQELRARVRVDEYNAWQHENTREHTNAIYQLQVIEPRMKNIPIDQEKVRRFRAELETTLDHIEQVFLKDQEYLAGKEMTIADLLGVCELMQPLAAGHDVTEGRPTLAAWVGRVKERLQPHFDDSHALLNRVRDRFLEGRL